MKIKTLCLCITLLFLSVSAAFGQRMSIKTNGLMLGLASPNLGVEFVTGNRTSFDVSAMACYHPYRKNIILAGVTPEFKYWVSGRPMARFYVGLIGAAATYDLTYKDKRYEGDLLGLGITAGYSIILSSHWNLEFGAGVGGAYLRQDELVKGNSGINEYIGSNAFKVIPMKLAISIAYIIK